MRVGMSPESTGGVGRDHGFPRVSGDEPVTMFGEENPSLFSPRERG